MRSLVLLAVIAACTREGAPERTPAKSEPAMSVPGPAPTPAPVTNPCDDSELRAIAARLGRCNRDADCALTRFTECTGGGLVCRMLPHNAGLSLDPYRKAWDGYFARCNERTMCKCAEPDTAICVAGACQAKPR